MFKQMLDRARAKFLASTAAPIGSVRIEGLEDRCLMHGGFGGFGLGFAGDDGGVPVPSTAGLLGLHAGRTIQFSQAPAAVQSGLKSLASTDNVTAPTDTTTVFLGNFNGVETYSININGTGTQTRLTVDQDGKPVTAATRSSTTFGAITNKAVTDELTALASALSLTAPTSSTPVEVITASDGTVTYTAALDRSTATTTNNDASDGFWAHHGEVVSVDSSGNPVGFERVPLSTLSTAIQNGLKDNAPSGATALTADSLIDVRTLNGVTTYSATYTSSGTTTTVTVDKAGKLASLPSAKTVDFSTLPKAAQDELQALATADGVSGTISSTQTVTAYDEANGTTIYTVRLSTTDSSTGTTSTFNLTLSVDQDGNPTVPPIGGRFGGFGFGGFGGGGCIGLVGGDGGDNNGGTTGTTTGGGTTTTNTPALTAADQSSSSGSSNTNNTGKKHKAHQAKHRKHHGHKGNTTTNTTAAT